MARKSKSRARAHPRANQTSETPSRTLRLPQSWRTVTSRKLAPIETESEDEPRKVPEIRLSGEWLARVGFPIGQRYLISADRKFETIYLTAELAKKARSK